MYRNTEMEYGGGADGRRWVSGRFGHYLWDFSSYAWGMHEVKKDLQKNKNIHYKLVLTIKK